MNEMTPQEQLLMAEVYAPVFLQKCAELGINIPDLDTLDAALETTAYVKQLNAAAQGNVIKKANHAIKTMLGVNSKAAVVDNARAVKEAAFNISKRPDIQNAVLSGILGKN